MKTEFNRSFVRMFFSWHVKTLLINRTRETANGKSLSVSLAITLKSAPINILEIPRCNDRLMEPRYKCTIHFIDYQTMRSWRNSVTAIFNTRWSPQYCITPVLSTLLRTHPYIRRGTIEREGEREKDIR